VLLDNGTNASPKGSAGRPESSVLGMCLKREEPAEPVLPICIFPVNGADSVELALPNTDSVDWALPNGAAPAELVLPNTDSVDWTLPNPTDAAVESEGSLANNFSSGELEPSKCLLPAFDLSSLLFLFPLKKSLNVANVGLTWCCVLCTDPCVSELVVRLKMGGKPGI